MICKQATKANNNNNKSEQTDGNRLKGLQENIFELILIFEKFDYKFPMINFEEESIENSNTNLQQYQQNSKYTIISF